ncbi:MAG: hypothetical protein EOO10_02995 [Chitinophagaceae bacterium]|nr:MAG: hypothetical protein EOO10_02995 [Chitinophagaceae bacterium]
MKTCISITCLFCLVANWSLSFLLLPYFCPAVGKAGLFLVFTVLFLNNTSLYQLSKIPVLIQHYREHRQLDDTVDLLEFLSMHYWGTDRNDDDDDRDRQLPFKEFSSHLQLNLYVPTQKQVVVATTVRYRPVRYPVLQNNLLTKPSLSSLFRPPKA